jgi:outer membrane protein assembly factor BamB/mono/diheme cytochrome c family protein
LAFVITVAALPVRTQPQSRAPVPQSTVQGPAQAVTQDLAHPQGTNAGILAFTARCATCHDARNDGAPDRYALNRRTPEEVLASITTGAMARYAEGLSEFERRIVAVYVGGRPIGAAAAGDASQMKNRCEVRPAFEPAKDAPWNGWGIDHNNSRFQPSPGLTAADASKLALKWAFGFPFGNSAYGQPAVVGGRVFVGADTGFVYSLDGASGCIYWSFRADAGVRTAVTIGEGNTAHPVLAYFGDVKGNVYAVNAETGKQVWKDRTDPHPVARVTGAPALVAGRLYVPLSSLEESGAGNPTYPCCSFRGGVVAYEAISGTRLWTSYTIPEAPAPLRKTSKGTQLWGPAGASVWTTPTIDPKRRAIYVATGNAYTEPAARGSDAVVAFDLDSGQRLWTSQVMADDAYDLKIGIPAANKSKFPAGLRAAAVCPTVNMWARDGHVWNQTKAPWSIRGLGLGASADVGARQRPIRAPSPAAGRIASLACVACRGWRRAGQRHSGRGVLRLDDGDAVRLFDPRRQGVVAVRHGARVRDGERGRGEGRHHERGRPGGRRRHGVHDIGLLRLGRGRPRQRPAGVCRAVNQAFNQEHQWVDNATRALGLAGADLLGFGESGFVPANPTRINSSDPFSKAQVGRDAQI